MRLLAGLIFAACAAAHADAPPADFFFKPAAIESGVASPDGKHIALVAADEKGFHRLITMDVATLKPHAIAALRETNVTNVHWVNDKRLVFQIVDPTRKWTEFTFPVGMYGVDHDGENFKYLVRFPEDHSQDAPVHDARMRWRMNAGGDEIFVSRWFARTGRKVEYVGLWRMDVRTGRLRDASIEGMPAQEAAPPSDLQARIDATLPGMTNKIDGPLVFSSTDRDPGRFYLYDRSKDKMVSIGRRRPEVDPAKMATREYVKEIDAWVTAPEGKGPKPTVIVKGTRGVGKEWDGPTQFVASRGYVVIEADRTEGIAQWASAKGIADAQRITQAELPPDEDEVRPLDFWTGLVSGR